MALVWIHPAACLDCGLAARQAARPAARPATRLATRPAAHPLSWNSSVLAWIILNANTIIKLKQFIQSLMQ